MVTAKSIKKHKNRLVEVNSTSLFYFKMQKHFCKNIHFYVFLCFLFYAKTFFIFNAKPQKENYDEVNKKVQAQREKQEKETLYRNKVDELNERIFKLRSDFVRDYVGKKEDTDIIIPYLIGSMLHNQYYDIDITYLLSVTDFKFDEDGNIYNTHEEYSSNPRRSLLAIVLSLTDSENLSYIKKNTIKDNRHINVTLNSIYMLLTKLGYQMSDEEKQLRDGTHEIFMEGKDDD